ncbi:MAG: LCP family protein [Firmicutes bacterium]|nr:LCP family protein [Dethiobacter sp.]MBS3888902.1 LCP family protein [Bacillota bacterium]MBS4053343.1 LCP family protein [Thermaerobacter sp.]
MHKVLRYVSAALGLLVCGMVGATVVLFNSLGASPPGDGPVVLTPPMINERVNILVLGADRGLLPGGTQGALRTDTIIVASFDPATSAVNVLSIPRDSRVRIPGRTRLDKINHAHAYGGIMLAVDTVEQLLDLPIHYYVRVETNAFSRVIDAIGGVDYFVEKDMYYHDPYQDLLINLKKGQQVLDGDKAMQYVRYRGWDGDIGRIARQQSFLLAMTRTFIRPVNLLRVNEIVQIALSSVRTNIDGATVLRHLPHLDKVAADKVAMWTMPGNEGWINGASYWLIDDAALDALLGERFWQNTREETSAVTVMIRDATGNSSGQPVARALRRRGFNVIAIETSTETVEKTQITAHQRKDAAGQMVFRALGRGLLVSEAGPHSSDVTIVLGKDFIREE